VLGLGFLEETMRMFKLTCRLVAGLMLASTAHAGELTAVGSGDGLDVLKLVAAAFTAENPAITIVLPPSIGSGGGLAAVASDSVILGRAARPLSDKDKAHGLKATPVFRIPATIYAHPSAKVTELTAKQLTDIFSGTVTNWNEVGGADLRIRVIRREEGESALTTLRATMPGWKDLAITGRSKSETNTSAVLTTVLGTEGAIAFASYSKSVVEQGAIALRIDGRAPTEPGYPAILTLNLIHKDATLTPDAKAFLDFVTSPKARAVIVAMGAAAPAD
jgi:phosphate transport system substrate-binding protein